MTAYEAAAENLRKHPSRWLVTGAAGFIGSHLMEALLKLGQRVTGFDNYSTGHRRNIEDVLAAVGGAAQNFDMIEGDITDYEACKKACQGLGPADRILHMAALGSVPRSMKDPLLTHWNNEGGFLTLLDAARRGGVRRFVYASSSSVYGDDLTLPKREPNTGRPLSPYALSKWMNEESAELFTSIFGMGCVGLRYFNVFGPRQDPEGAYAAVIPRWFAALREGRRPTVYGDGLTSRDFCYIENVVRANILAATTENAAAFGEAFNIACGERTTLNDIFAAIRDLAAPGSGIEPVYEDFRPGDIAHSLASIEKAQDMLCYEPAVMVREGLAKAAEWYMNR